MVAMRDEVRLRCPPRMATTIHTRAADGRDFHRQVAIFGYGEYVRRQRGVVLLAEGEFRKHADGSITATLTYVAVQEEPGLLPPEVVPMVREYDPDRECVLCMVETTGKATCITLTARRTGATPKHLFEEALTARQHVPILPGTVVRVTDWTAGIDPGLYVFLREEKSEMALSPVGEDGNGNMAATDEIHRVHVDYRDALEVTRLSIGLVGER